MTEQEEYKSAPPPLPKAPPPPVPVDTVTNTAPPSPPKIAPPPVMESTNKIPPPPPITERARENPPAAKPMLGDQKKPSGIMASKVTQGVLGLIVVSVFMTVLVPRLKNSEPSPGKPKDEVSQPAPASPAAVVKVIPTVASVPAVAAAPENSVPDQHEDTKPVEEAAKSTGTVITGPGVIVGPNVTVGGMPVTPKSAAEQAGLTTSSDIVFTTGVVRVETISEPMKFGEPNAVSKVYFNGAEIFADPDYMILIENKNLKRGILVLSEGSGGNKCAADAYRILNVGTDGKAHISEAVEECNALDSVDYLADKVLMSFSSNTGSAKKSISVDLINPYPVTASVSTPISAPEAAPAPVPSGSTSGLKALIGQDPQDVAKNEEISKKLKAMAQGSQYADLLKNLTVASGSTQEGDYLFGSGCAPHMCGEEFGAIAVNLITGEVFAGIISDEGKKNITLGGSAGTKELPKPLQEWQNMNMQVNAR